MPETYIAKSVYCDETQEAINKVLGGLNQSPGFRLITVVRVPSNSQSGYGLRLFFEVLAP